MEPIKYVEHITAEYAKEIAHSISNTDVFRTDVDSPEKPCTSQELVTMPVDSVNAAFMNSGRGKVCILNFASYKQPGGGFLKGMMAQEEALCSVSTLYPVLAEFGRTYYSWNQKNLNKGMYTNAALYSPDILFFASDGRAEKFDVLTCAAPNISSGKRYGTVSEMENSAYLCSRIKFMYDVASKKKVDTLILGAWGCGVFKQDPHEVARLLCHYGKESSVRRLVFAIPDVTSRNYKAFIEVFDEEASI